MEKVRNTQRTGKSQNSQVLRRIQKQMPDAEMMLNLADFFKVLGDMTRINILYALSREVMRVQDIATLLEMNQSAISHQLRILKQARLVKYRRDGTSMYYTLDDEHVHEIFSQGFDHVKEKY
jgi:ArsR family transcriptional regulator